MTTIALLGAGGKMGYRLSTNFRGSPYSVRHVEISEAGKERLKTGLGIETLDVDEALDGAAVVILAVPDTHIGKVSASIESKLAPGTMVIVLDAAAPFAGHLPNRPDLTYFVTHPCHPPIFNDETDLAAKRDFFGGVNAKQHFVSALMQGPEADYAKGEQIARTIWAPVMRSHRVTVEQMALLEPGLSETVCASLLVVMREALDEVVARGVDRQAALDFLLGHMNVLGAVIFGEAKGVFSDACNKAIEFGKPALMREDWKRVFEPEEIAASIRRIT
ncbi:phosphogluconate dehydrogenase C-terminal domain-containing protein [Mesorhizobium sp.]|uniref:phosphogluconate dehydrogenase C-terminal domain-containing protein n=1 Tax=Mesorhizobium sp. TaxID=1871066 RepID=UPI000FE491E8|nr:phosphogluconate dehydrogenase C-terminal domain-containing protein [Mesorhizobium sp.]RWG06152.1 MAG: semialdehyde dehydrogenase [Mesorhizobium sp.]RWH01185.1 MAG: semialdehyde dehydrogenase [Mesorhizobium sp.]RWI16813.1 MAG: semialdehyde dehydrogenase [Mesorhizobium sp.]RWN07760.1 MAG: semialdehyde dehydrogenase [Mesorhizobium sp.]RWN12481.1 MAG: semialdehyde dehydrogenase [Mesorhizobium sp.]